MQVLLQDVPDNGHAEYPRGSLGYMAPVPAQMQVWDINCTSRQPFVPTMRTNSYEKAAVMPAVSLQNMLTAFDETSVAEGLKVCTRPVTAAI